jgi:hypothetical protein
MLHRKISLCVATWCAPAIESRTERVISGLAASYAGMIRAKVIVSGERHFREQGVDRDPGLRAPVSTHMSYGRDNRHCARRLPTKSGEAKDRAVRARYLSVKSARNCRRRARVIASRPTSARLSWPGVKPAGTITTKAFQLK